MARLETLDERWRRLQPHVARYGAPDSTGPLTLLFHGCGGVQSHLDLYAQAAADQGGEGVIIDSYAPRGWSRSYGLGFVCTGAVFRGAERAGDVLAAVWGLTDGGRDGRPVVLAGWSHGAWAIMDLMTMPLSQAGEAGIADPGDACLAQVRGLFLAYPYGGVGALSRVRPWVRSAEILAVAPLLDHVTNIRDARRLYRRPREAGCAVETWEPRARHSFDEPTGVAPWRRDNGMSGQSLARFQGFLARLTDQTP